MSAPADRCRAMYSKGDDHRSSGCSRYWTLAASKNADRNQATRCGGRCGEDRSPDEIGDGQHRRPFLERRLIGQVICRIGRKAKNRSTEFSPWRRAFFQSGRDGQKRQSNDIKKIKGDGRRQPEIRNQHIAHDHLIETACHCAQPGKVDRYEDYVRHFIGNKNTLHANLLHGSVLHNQLIRVQSMPLHRSPATMHPVVVILSLFTATVSL